MRILTLADLSADATAALQASPFGPFTVEACQDIDQLGERLEADAFDAVLLDAVTPNLTQAAVVQAAADSALLIVSGSPDPAATIEWLELGAQNVLARDDLVAAYLPQRIRIAIERKRLESEARKAYATDLETGLPHQQQLIEHMSHLLALREREPSPMAVLVLRIEGLSTTEVRLGREAANVLRRKVAVRLRAGVRASDVVAAIGTESFAVLLASILTPADAPRVGTKLLMALSAPFNVTGNDLSVAVALGIGQYPQDGAHPDGLLHRAIGLAASAPAQGRAGLSNFHEAGGRTPGAANDE